MKSFSIIKALRKAIIIRSRMKGLYLNKKTDLNWSNYKQLKNFCTNLLRSTFENST